MSVFSSAFRTLLFTYNLLQWLSRGFPGISDNKESACNVGDSLPGLERSLENGMAGMATHSSNLPWRIPQTEEPGRLQLGHGITVRHHWVTNTHIHNNDHIKIYISSGDLTHMWWNSNWPRFHKLPTVSIFKQDSNHLLPVNFLLQLFQQCMILYSRVTCKALTIERLLIKVLSFLS